MEAQAHKPEEFIIQDEPYYESVGFDALLLANLKHAEVLLIPIHY